MKRILVFGASIVWGAWDKEGGWVQRLFRFLDQQKNLIPPNRSFYLTYNLGISGNTTENLLERFEFETKKRLKQNNGELILLFGIGTNDSAFIKNKNNNWVNSEKFRKNLIKLINRAKKYSCKIVFVGLTPVEESKTTPVVWDENIFHKNEYAKKYDSILKSTCEENKIYFIELFDGFVHSNFQSYLEDGLHPNSAGHQKIFEIVRDFLVENKLI